MLAKTRRFLRKIALSLPENWAERVLLIAGYRRIVLFRIRRLKARLPFTRLSNRYVTDTTLYHIDPRSILNAMSCSGNSDHEKHADNEFDVHKDHGRVVSGNWDTLDTKFDELDFYTSYQERASIGTIWERLPYYRRVLGEIEAGKEKWDCESKQDLDRRCQRLDEIFEDILRNGYKSRKLLREIEGNNGVLWGEWEDQDEITVNVGRHGDLIFNNGRHRLTFAKIAGVQKVPVRITVRHALWESFKKEIMQYALRNGGLVYSPITHIDLQHVPAMYADVRWDLIKSNLGKGNSTVLDIGAHWGYFCHKFEEEGFRCFAVEVDHENVYFLHKLRRAANREFTVIPKSIFDLRREGPLKYDIVLALAVFHHFIKEERTFRKLKDLLPRLDMNEMYFEPHLYDEPEMRDAFMNFTPEEFVHFILQNSCLNNYRLLGKCERGKPVFKLWRE